MPFMGAIVDYTNHRLKIARILTALYCCLLFPQIFISSSTWFAVAILQIAVAFIGWGQTMLTYAYLPELTSDEQVLNKYSSNFTVVQFGSMVVYLMGVAGVSAVAGLADDEVATARIGQAVSFVVASVALSYAWSLFLPRPTTRDLPEGQSFWTAGFIQVWHTSIRIYKHYKALKWFYVSVAFADAAVYSLATIAITYLTDQLQFTALENGIAILAMLVGSVPGGVLAGWCTARFHNPIWTSIASVTILAINTLVVGIVLREPGQQMATYLLAAGWGIGTGGKWTADRLLSSPIIPAGQDAELMGLYLFAGQVITWVPPLLFTGMNEAGVSQRIGIISLDVFFCVSIIAYFFMGSYKEASEMASRHKPDAPQTQENLDDLALSQESSIETIQP
jgi:MFS-type transporter involved in bile tolerance (Atg22 family)